MRKTCSSWKYIHVGRTSYGTTTAPSLQVVIKHKCSRRFAISNSVVSGRIVHPTPGCTISHYPSEQSEPSAISPLTCYRVPLDITVWLVSNGYPRWHLLRTLQIERHKLYLPCKGHRQHHCDHSEQKRREETNTASYPTQTTARVDEHDAVEAGKQCKRGLRQQSDLDKNNVGSRGKKSLTHTEVDVAPGLPARDSLVGKLQRFLRPSHTRSVTWTPSTQQSPLRHRKSKDP